MNSIHIGSILLATDLRSGADVILAGASALADRMGAALHVIHAVEFLTVPYSAVSAADDYQRRIHEARDTLQRLTDRLPNGVARPRSQEVREENPARAILERAGEVAADLIVLGPPRKRAFAKAFLGNTPDRLLGAARVPVLVLHAVPPLEVRRVVVPIDLADPARGALDQGLLWAARPGSAGGEGEPDVAVRVLYVIPRKYENAGASFTDVVIRPQLTLEIEDAQQRVGAAGAVPIVAETVWGDEPADEIVRFVETDPPDLLVLGTHGYGTIGRVFIGSVTSRIVRSASCPMLLIPPSMWVRDHHPHAHGQP